jgi:hypothetical protein
VGWSFSFPGEPLDRLKILLDFDYLKASTILKTVWQWGLMILFAVIGLLFNLPA